MLLYASSLGGIDFIKQTMGNIVERKSWRGQGSLAYYPGMLLMTAPAISLLVALYNRFKFKLFVMGLCLLSVSLPMLIATQASREKALFPIIMVLICMYYYRKRQEKVFHFTKRAMIAAVFLIIFIIGFLIHSAYRHEHISRGRPFYFQLISDFNRIDISVVMYFNFVINGQSYLYGKPFLSYVIQPFVRLFGVNPIPNTSELLGESIFPNE